MTVFGVMEENSNGKYKGKYKGKSKYGGFSLRSE
jgi:hypothetical protein